MKLSLYCEFGTNLDYSLRDRLVCGLHNEPIQKRLPSEPSLSLPKETEIALALKAAAKDSQELQGKKESEVNKLTKGNEKTKMKEEVKSKHHCYRCGSHQHTSTQRYFREQSCRKCGKVRHIQRVCRSGKVQQLTSQGEETEENRKLHSFEIDDELDDDSLIQSLEINNV